MRVLVTNDDGVWAPGIAVLARALRDHGLDVVVAAPLDDRSGSSAAIGPGYAAEGIAVERAELPDLEGVPAHGVEGPPGMAVIAARLGAFGAPPDIVMSGINPGNNTGRSVLHSGTVGAALTAANFGARGVAVSVGVAEGEVDPHFDTAAVFAVRAYDWLFSAPVGTVLNVNVPNVPMAEVRGVKAARLAPFGTVRTALAGSEGGRLQLEMRATGVELEPDTDTALVQAGYVAVTPLVGVRASDGGEQAADFLERALT
ncbi:MAG: 5'/3'-nucleotidase SurE [Actinobacteria bacterium]|nr:5'/3'-nucleotidase SurE [Actinomycetota bacterium]